MDSTFGDWSEKSSGSDSGTDPDGAGGGGWGWGRRPLPPKKRWEAEFESWAKGKSTQVGSDMASAEDEGKGGDNAASEPGIGVGCTEKRKRSSTFGQRCR